MGTNPATKHTDEFRRETADYVISSGRPITECCRELGLNSKTVNRWVVERRRELSGEPDPKAEDRELRELRKTRLLQGTDFSRKRTPHRPKGGRPPFGAWEPCAQGDVRQHRPPRAPKSPSSSPPSGVALAQRSQRGGRQTAAVVHRAVCRVNGRAPS